MFKVISQHIGPMPTDAVQVSIFANFEYNQYGSLYLLLTWHMFPNCDTKGSYINFTSNIKQI